MSVPQLSAEDILDDVLPDDDKRLPKAVSDAVEALSKAIRDNGPYSFTPDFKKRIDITGIIRAEMEDKDE